MKACLLIVALATGCSDGGSQVNITKPVGTGGGTVSGSDGTSVTIPMGALNSQANITISSITVAAPAGTVIVGPAYDFGPEGTTFAQPVTITLPIDPSKIPSGRTAADVKIYTAPKGSTNYTTLVTTAGSNNTVTASTTHFTVHLPAAPAAAVAGSDMAMADCQSCTATVMGSNMSCSCTGKCGGKTYLVQCAQETTTTPPFCFCEIDNQTQSTSPKIDTCSDTLVKQAWRQCLPS